MSENKKIILPFGSTVVPGHSSICQTVRSQSFMKVERLWVSREVGSCFMLADIKTGNVSQFASAGEFSMAIFDNEQFKEPGSYPDPGIGIIGPPIYVGLWVRNIYTSARLFSGHFEGVECDPPTSYKLGAGDFIT
jgi:hypothetical protein